MAAVRFVLICFTFIIVRGDTDGPFSILGLSGYAGEIVVNTTTESSLFYYLFQSITGNIQTDTNPLLIWLPGGPGGSVSVDLFGERISPLYVNNLGEPEFNNMTWALRIHILGVDFPYGTGFSYPTYWSDWITDIQTGAKIFTSFLNILQKKYPSWFNRDIYIGGQDYSGLFIPSIVQSLISQHNISPTISPNPLNIKGVILGDPWINGLQIVNSYSTFAYNQGLANANQEASMSIYQNYIIGNASIDPQSAYNSFQTLFSYIDSISGSINLYNYRLYNDEDLGNLTGFLNNPKYKQMFNVPSSVIWSQISDSVNSNLSSLIFISQTQTLSAVLKSCKVMIFSTQYDFLINSISVSGLIDALDWSGIYEFKAARRGVWNVAGNVAGYAQSYSNLTSVQLVDSGLLAPLDQALNTRDMIFRFMFNQGWN